MYNQYISCQLVTKWEAPNKKHFIYNSIRTLWTFWTATEQSRSCVSSCLSMNRYLVKCKQRRLSETPTLDKCFTDTPELLSYCHVLVFFCTFIILFSHMHWRASFVHSFNTLHNLRATWIYTIPTTYTVLTVITEITVESKWNEFLKRSLSSTRIISYTNWKMCALKHGDF